MAWTPRTGPLDSGDTSLSWEIFIFIFKCFLIEVTRALPASWPHLAGDELPGRGCLKPVATPPLKPLHPPGLFLEGS